MEQWAWGREGAAGTMGTLSSSALGGTKVGVLSGLALTERERSFCRRVK